MRIRKITSVLGDTCPHCANLIFPGDATYVEAKDDSRVYCTTNCLTRDVCDRQLKAHIDAVCTKDGAV